MIKKLLILFVTVIQWNSIFSQPSNSGIHYYIQGNIPIVINGKTLSEPFTGGYNSTQFQPFDLDNNGIMDLLCFDRTDNKILPFLRISSDQFRYAPQYESFIPKGYYYMKTADLNSDGRLDVFTLDESSNLIIHLNQTTLLDTAPEFKNLGPMIYRNQYNDTAPIKYNGLSLSSTDLPEIKDVDGDGDLDIITYDQGNGVYRMYSDVRVEKKWPKDTFEFQIMDICFGWFNDMGNTINLDNCPYSDKLKPRHSGGAAILLFDNDADGDMDIVLSNIGIKSSTFLTNGKKNLNNHYDTMVAYDTIFPKNTQRLASYYFPAAYMVDVDGDTTLDLVTSPTGGVNGFAQIKETNQLWYYRNFGKNNKPDFRFQKNNFLQENTLDLGGQAVPAFADYDADGDMDLFIANDGDFEISGGHSNRIALFKNTGKSNSASFEFVTDDYLTISKLNLANIKINFGDLDGDKDVDLLLGDLSGRVLYFQNSGGKGNAFQFKYSDTNSIPAVKIDKATNAAPAVFNYNNDSLPDLLIGYTYGGVKLLVNTGNVGQPKYTITPGNAWGMRANEWYFNDPDYTMISFGNAVPTVTDLDHDGTDEILIGTSYGRLRLYHPAGRSVFDSLSAEKNWFWQKSFADSIEPDLGSEIAVASQDLDGDNFPELIIGNSRGGINLATARFIKKSDAIQNITKPEFKLYPNPAQNQITIERGNITGNWSIKIYSLLGKEMYSAVMLASESDITLHLPGLSDGVYLAEVSNGVAKTVKKFVIRKP